MACALSLFNAPKEFAMSPSLSANLQGKRALVTGGAAGIGLATVRMLALNGAQVAVNDLPGSVHLTEVVHQMRTEGLQVFSAPADIGDDAQVRDMVSLAASTMGGLDYLVNNAATPGTREAIPASDLERQDDAFWNTLLSVNLIGPYRCARAALAHLQASHGAIVNVASTAGLGAGGSSTAYASSKAGLILLTRELAKGLGPAVRVNAVAPGWVGGTEWQCQWDASEAESAVRQLPLQRLGCPDDFAEAIFFLCASGRYITGHTLVVDGGLTA